MINVLKKDWLHGEGVAVVLVGQALLSDVKTRSSRGVEDKPSPVFGVACGVMSDDPPPNNQGCSVDPTCWALSHHCRP
jgi:hypothetical protein